MLETTDTTQQFQLTPPGKKLFTIVSTPLKKPTKNGDKLFFEFKFEYENDLGNTKKHTEIFMPWNLPPILKALGFEETEKNKFSWDRELCVNKKIAATVVHEPDKSGKMWARMTDFQKAEEIPF